MASHSRKRSPLIGFDGLVLLHELSVLDEHGWRCVRRERYLPGTIDARIPRTSTRADGWRWVDRSRTEPGGDLEPFVELS